MKYQPFTQSRSVKLTQFDPVHDSYTTGTRIERAIALARVSDMRQKHGAILVVGGRVLSTGINTWRNVIEDHIPYDAISNHAEISCLGPVGRNNTKNGKLYVARISSGGNIAGSKPCDACLKYISVWTLVREVIFT